MAGIRQFNEDKALESAMHLFWQKGFGATSMQDLAEATGVLRGSLYNAYGDKQSIFLLAYSRHKARFLGAVGDALDQPTLEESLHAFLDLCISSMSEPCSPDSPATRGCMTTRTATEQAAQEEPIRSALRELVDELSRLLEARLSAAAEELTLPSAAAARLLVLHTRGMVVIERLYHDADSLRASADALVSLLLRK
ncbi:TetR/AcrR family transcriptional regulator [Massilia endophytica]|uniref:TetR/AcrR family transcriptional regulator n=1 Tax=Massilia endophytica TaxID=2899220 RepID=UPI001E2A1889|nr:TetR/AcrR family transcriptional regulator [Massilia endophytica]UGQ45777.1 TetR/AcrR family transcriptional regulator [Massilia endophytica]